MFEKLKNDFMAGFTDAEGLFSGKKHYRIYWLGIIDTESAQPDRPARVAVVSPASGVSVNVPEIVAEVI